MSPRAGERSVGRPQTNFKTASRSNPQLSAEGLRFWRTERWLSQTDLAGLLGTAVLTVSRWETGQIRIPPYLHLALERLDEREKWYPRQVRYVPVAERNGSIRGVS